MGNARGTLYSPSSGSVVGGWVTEKGNAECNERIHIVGALSAGWLSELLVLQGEEDFRWRRLSTFIRVQQLSNRLLVRVVYLKVGLWMVFGEEHTSDSFVVNKLLGYVMSRFDRIGY